MWGTPEPAPLPIGPADGHFDDVVIGAGFTGLTTALLLDRSGRSVAVLEARHVGAGASGATTGKLSLLQGTKLSAIRAVHSSAIARAYVDANREGQAWLLEFCSSHGVDVERRAAVTYAAEPGEVRAVRDEYDAARSLGLEVEWSDTLDVPFPTSGAVVLPEQAQFQPREVLTALAAQFQLHGGLLHENARVTGVSKLGQPTVTTADGREFHGANVVLATGAPILDRGLYFAKLEAKRSYLSAFALEGDVLEQMLISAGSPTRSLRGVPGDVSRLLVGGNGHVVGRGGSEAARIDDLREWTAKYFPGAVETHAWAAQDHTSHDGIPYVGLLPRGRARVHVATGYDKWGLANAVAAARTISGTILGSAPSWSKPLGRRITHPKSAMKIVTRNARAASAAAGALLAAELREVGSRAGGEVGRVGFSPVPVAVTTEQGEACRLVGVCTHLGAALRWNDAENSWDCPWHGSRFAADGSVLDGPATRPLDRKE
ncbi:MAG: FAD-dependent oxidoreductase [Propionibacteriales bacterium]|nr:FAD-dependent oxidoreductase [Propionibacteriales bacterium]